MDRQPIKTHMPSVAQLILSVVGLFSVIGSVIYILLIKFAFKSIPELPTEMNFDIPATFWIILVISFVGIPSMILAIRRLARWNLPQVRRKKYSLLVSSCLILFLIGGIILINRDASIINIPLVNMLLSLSYVVIPLLWLIDLGQNQLNPGSRQRRWGLVNFAIFGGLPIVMLVEFVLLLFAAVFLISQIDYKPLLMTLQTQLMLDPTSYTSLLHQFTPLAENPKVWVTGFLLVSLLIPIIEEILKPLALWFFIKRAWSPSEGFTAGLILGASFALVESATSLSAVSPELWVTTLIGRCGTGLLHIVTTGLTGWALVASWQDGKYLRIGGAYLFSVLLHGTWNFFALIFGLGSNFDFLPFQSITSLVETSPWVMGGLAVVMLIILIVMNRVLYKKSKPPALIFSNPPDIPPLPFQMMQ